jgi:ferredoxin/flavodoxin---NADP+ reductase
LLIEVGLACSEGLVVMAGSQELNAVLTRRTEISPGSLVIRVVPERWQVPPFKPGQFAVLGLPPEAPRCEAADAEDPTPKRGLLIRRAYSIASSSVEREYLEFYVTLVYSGSFTPRLFALKEGDRLWLGPTISGLFTFDEVPARANIVMIATGTGLAPYMSQLRTHLTAEEARRYAVIHGARHSWDLGYRGELYALERVCPTLTYLPVISRLHHAPEPWGGAMGYVQDVWQGGHVGQAWGFGPSPSNTHVFLCGNPDMIDAMVEILRPQGFREHAGQQPGEIHSEKYW